MTAYGTNRKLPTSLPTFRLAPKAVLAKAPKSRSAAPLIRSSGITPQ